MYSICKIKAFTLIELLITLIILAIIVSLALPHFHRFKENQERAQILPIVRQAVSLAKINATTYHSTVIICPSSTYEHCENNKWNSGFIIFVDQNNNKKFDEQEKLIHSIPLDLHYGSFDWNGGITSKDAISFQSDSGLPRGSIGHFRYCSASSESDLIIPLSMMGQTRLDESATC